MTLAPDIASFATCPEIAKLNLSALADDDLVNLILKRSEVLYDQRRAGRVVRAWERGNDTPMRAQVDRLGVDVARRAAGVILREYQSLADTLSILQPKRVADIGCGYAFFDLFLARDLGAKLLLIDLEFNERRHFGFQSEGAAYSSLAVARRLLEDNGIDSGAIETLNPRDLAAEKAGPVDLIVSFLSCGYHYPVDLYLPFIDRVLASGGAAIFDLRSSSATEQREKLAAFGLVTELPSPHKAQRVLLQKN